MMKRNTMWIIAAILMLAMVVTACSAPAEEQEKTVNADAGEPVKETVEVISEYPMTITDGFDREVVLNEEPMKIVSLAPSVTETLYALGRGDRIVGRTAYDTYPEQVLDVPSVGSLSEPSIETIAELEPDLVIASTHFQKETLAKLEQLEIPVVVLIQQEDFEGTYALIEKAGEIVNAQAEAAGIVEEMKTIVSDVTEMVAGQESVSTYYVIGYGEYGDYTATGETFIHNMIAMAGGENVAAEATGWSYSIEKLVEDNPQVVLCSKYDDIKTGIEAANGYKDLDAVKNGKLIEVDNNMIDRQGPRLALGLLEIAKALHPEVFEGYAVH